MDELLRRYEANEDLGPDELFELGMCIEDDDTKAAECLTKAAALGHADAMFNLGLIYNMGRGVPQDYNKSFEWLQKAADLGNPGAIGGLARYYIDGIGVEQDQNKGIQLLHKAAELGDESSIEILENNGFDVVLYKYLLELPGDISDEEKGKLIYEKFNGYHKQWEEDGQLYVDDSVNQRSKEIAADLGYDDALFHLAQILDVFNYSPEEKLTWIRKAAEKGHAPSICRLGFCYFHGDTVEQDVNKAIELWESAAEKGDAEAMNDLGAVYSGEMGLPRDAEKCFEWTRRAANAGHRGAEFQMGRAFYNGDPVNRDQEEAARWWQKAAEQGHTVAMVYLGIMHHAGEGVWIDFNKSFDYFANAVKNGEANAEKEIESRVSYYLDTLNLMKAGQLEWPPLPTPSYKSEPLPTPPAKEKKGLFGLFKK